MELFEVVRKDSRVGVNSYTRLNFFSGSRVPIAIPIQEKDDGNYLFYAYLLDGNKVSRISSENIFIGKEEELVYVPISGREIYRIPKTISDENFNRAIKALSRTRKITGLANKLERGNILVSEEEEIQRVAPGLVLVRGVLNN